MATSALRRSLRTEARTLVVLAAAAGWLVVIGFQLFDETVRLYVSDLGTAVAAVAAGLACFGAAKRAEDRLRWVWVFVGLSALFWGSGQVVWSYYELVARTEVPFPSAADVGFLAAVPMAVVGMLLFPRPGSTGAGQVRALVDGAIIALSALITSWVFLLGDVFRSGGTKLEHAISLAYPIGDIIVVTIALYVLLLRHRSRGSFLLASLIGIAFVAIAFSDSAFTYMTAKGNYATGTLVDAGWLVGFAILAVAAFRPARLGSSDLLVRPAGRILPYVAVAGALVTSALAQTKLDTSDAFLSWLRTGLIAALVIRQMFILAENSSLTSRLEQRLRELRRSEQRFAALALHSSDVVTVVDAQGTVLYQSESLLRVFGYRADELVGHPITSVTNHSGGGTLLSALAQVAAQDGAIRVVELEIRHADGHVCHAEITVTNLIDDPAVGGIVLNTRDISERKRLETQLVHEASHDPLTRLANRSLFRTRVEHELRRNDDRPAKLTILFLDLDGFKEVNDSLGHATGDTLLIQVSERIQSCVRPSDVVARLGGDEFAVLVADRSSERDGTVVADRITGALGEPFFLEGREIHISASVGIASTDYAVDDADHLLRNADLAMYRAKASGDRYERYHPQLRVAAVERMELEGELRKAITGGELELHYQPSVSLATGAVEGAEALARWKHPERGYVSPGEFVPLAEEAGLIRGLGRWGLVEACRQLAHWHANHPEHRTMSVSVNISGRHLEELSLTDDVQEALALSGIEPGLLVLEMTESVLMANTDETVDLLGRIKELGVRLAIDDFGTGYSSLAYLHRFPADVIKIDRSFVERLNGSDVDIELLRTIVRLGQGMRMITVAEGVETAEQASMLRAMGCELAQGFHFFRPLTPAQFDRLFEPTGLDKLRVHAA